MSEYKVRYKVGSAYLSEDEYKQSFGSIPNRLNTYSNYKHRPTNFEEHYEPALGQWCTSWRDKINKVEKFNKEQARLPKHMKNQKHPDGFVFTADLENFTKDCKHAHRHRDELQRESIRKMNKDEIQDSHARKFGLKRGTKHFSVR